MPGRREILANYSQSVEGAQSIGREGPTPTEFMLDSSPGENKVVYKGRTYYSSYSNADSARRAFTKLRKNETTGEKMYARSELYTFQGKHGEGFRVAKPKGGFMYGLWKANVYFDYMDEDGEWHTGVKSFVVQDKHDRFQSQFAKRQIEYELNDEIESHLEMWAESGSQPMAEWEVRYVEIVRIQTTSKTSRYIVEI